VSGEPAAGQVVTDDPPGSLTELIAGTGIDLVPRQVANLAAYRDLLFERNRQTNLTAVRDLPGIERRLVIESLRLVAPLRALPRIDTAGSPALLDVGTGGGIPGMVLAIACPDLNVFLLDATGKKVAFLDDVRRELDLPNVTTLHGRAEEIGHQPRFRNGFDLVTARAVSALPTLLELGLPFLRTGGHMVLPKGLDIDGELDAGFRAAAILGAEILSSDVLPPSESTIETRLVLVRKTSITPRAYPRRAGIPAKSPLGTEPASKRGRTKVRDGGGTA